MGRDAYQSAIAHFVRCFCGSLCSRGLRVWTAMQTLGAQRCGPAACSSRFAKQWGQQNQSIVSCRSSLTALELASDAVFPCHCLQMMCNKCGRTFYPSVPGPRSMESIAMKASCGTLTLPMDFMRFLPSACFFSSFFFLQGGGRRSRSWAATCHGGTATTATAMWTCHM